MGSLILIIEDDPEIRELIALDLRKHHYSVRTAPDGRRGLVEVREHPPALIILDLLLPEVDGWAVCRTIKGDPKTRAIPLVILTALGEEQDRVRGLDAGADDYLTKPFSIKELLARIRALLRRSRAGKNEIAAVLRVGSLTIDADRHEVQLAGKSLHLTPTGFALLKYLAQNPGKVFSRDQLITALWREDRFVEEHNVDVHIHALRKQLASNTSPAGILQTVRGVGYKLLIPDADR